MYRMSRVQQVERKRGFCGLQSKQKLWFLNAPLVDSLPSLTLTYHLKMVVSNRNLLFQRSIFRSYVSFREGNGLNMIFSSWWLCCHFRNGQVAPITVNNAALAYEAQH